MIEAPDVLIANTENAIAHWNLGPKVVDQPNDPYWARAAQIFDVPLEVAKRRLCVNCEYYDNTPERLAEMEAVPLNQYDIYATQAHRGYCHKLHFICHTTRSCQAWEEKEYELEGEPKDLAKTMFPDMAD